MEGKAEPSCADVVRFVLVGGCLGCPTRSAEEWYGETGALFVRFHDESAADGSVGGRVAVDEEGWLTRCFDVMRYLLRGFEAVRRVPRGELGEVGRRPGCCPGGTP